MDSKDITRMMIDTAVARGIKDMEADPKRTLRKLTDLGKQLSSGRFHYQIFEIIQGCLSNDNSPYYALLADFLRTTDHEAIRRFGINMGYNCWTYNARVIRRRSEEMGIYLPWIVFFHYRPDRGISGTSPQSVRALTIGDMRRFIGEAIPLGINAFCIIQEGETIADPALIELFRENPECGFFLFLGSAELTAAQMTRFSACGNVLLCINADAPDAMDACRALKDARALYSIYHVYHDEELDSLVSDPFMDRYLTFGASMLFYMQAPDCVHSAGQRVKEARIEQKYHCFLWDLYADERQISSIICDGDTLLCIDSDGSLIRPQGSAFNVLDKDEPLEQILYQTMPRRLDADVTA